MERLFEETMEQIVASIRSAGYEPYDQLYGYVKTGDETYITRAGDARKLIKELDSNRVRRFVEELRFTKLK